MIIFFSKNQKTEKEETVNDMKENRESFYSIADSLLVEAKSYTLSDRVLNQDLIDKANRLSALGFNNAKEVQYLKSKEVYIEELKDKNSFIEAVNYFSSKYPNGKLITVQAIEDTCQEYGFACPTAHYYTY